MGPGERLTALYEEIRVHAMPIKRYPAEARPDGPSSGRALLPRPARPSPPTSRLRACPS